MHQAAKKMEIIITPHCRSDEIHALETRVKIEACEYPSGFVIGSIPFTIAGCQTAKYSDKNLHIYDDNGEIEFHTEVSVGELGPQHDYSLGRDASGTLTMVYSCETTIIDYMISRPLFSLYKSGYGCTVSGLAFLLLPEEGLFNISLDYDLTETCSEGHTFCGLGAGKLEFEGKCEELKNTFYCINATHFYHREGSKVHIAWFEDDLKHAMEFCEITETYFDYLQELFIDEDRPYFIIVHRNDLLKLTGTAFSRICILGFGSELIESIKQIECVLCHELVHNWLSVEEGTYTSAIFSEGTAEFFGAKTSYSVGRIDKDELVDRFNKMLMSYYSNPRRADDCKTVCDEAWSYAWAQLIVYGRGVILMLILDSLIRKHTDEKENLENVCRTIRSRQNSGIDVSWEDFRKIVSDITDGESDESFERAASDGLMIPPKDYFGDEYYLCKESVREMYYGFDDSVRMENPRIIHGLVKGSNADKAGLKDGDVIIKWDSEFDLSEDKNAMCEFEIERNGERMQIKYLPRGREISCWQYRKKK